MQKVYKLALVASLLVNGVALSVILTNDVETSEPDGLLALAPLDDSQSSISTFYDQSDAEINSIYETEIRALLNPPQVNQKQATEQVAKKQVNVQPDKGEINPNHPEMIMNAAFVTDSMVYGNEDARFKIVSYADIECPSCRKIHSHLKAVVDYAPDQVHWEYKHFPLSHHNPSAISQAAIVECTFNEKGNQFAWLILGEFIKHTKGSGKGQANYAAFAEHVRVEPDWLLSCAQNREYQVEVEKEYQMGMELGVVGTPTLFITDTQTGNTKRLEAFNSAEQISRVLYAMSR